MRSGTKAKCLSCKELFRPDYRNRGRQSFCAKAECRKASKAQSQHRWLEQPENQNYFRGAENTARVQRWRKEHPGYWRHKKSAPDALQGSCPEPLQETFSSQSVEHQVFTPALPSFALQDGCLMQPAVLVGLISILTGSALQEDIEASARRFFIRGQDIMGIKPLTPAPRHENQTRPLSPATALRAPPF
jgi:hypothetical protein